MSWPISRLKKGFLLQFTAIYFLCIFTADVCTFEHLLLLYFLYFQVYREIRLSLEGHPPQNKIRKKVIWNIVTLLMLVLTIHTYFIQKRVLHLWTNTHFVPVGYLFVQLLIFWVPQVIYLNEGLSLTQEEQPSPSLKQNLLRKIQNC